ncbi:MAG: hypothetical protein R6U65_00980 [Perlabentimonas sp.]
MRKLVEVELKDGRKISVFDYEVENLKKQGLLKKPSQKKEEKQTPQTKEDKTSKKTK